MITWELGNFKRANIQHFHFSDGLNQFTSKTVPVDPELRRKKSLDYKAFAQLLNDTKLGIGRSLGQFFAEIPQFDQKIKTAATNIETVINSLDYLQLQANAKAGELGDLLEEKVLAANPLALSVNEIPHNIPQQLVTYGSSNLRHEDGINSTADRFLDGMHEVVQQKKIEEKQTLDYLNGLVGGLDNALRTYFGLARVACIKFFEACGEDFNELKRRSKSLRALLKNTKHISTELSKLNMGMFGLLDNMSGVVINSNKPYLYDVNKFDIYNYKGGLYLLPRHGFLELAKYSFSKNPDIISQDGDNETKEKAHDLAKEGVRGCFALEQGETSESKTTLMDGFFTATESLIRKLVGKLS